MHDDSGTSAAPHTYPESDHVAMLRSMATRIAELEAFVRNIVDKNAARYKTYTSREAGERACRALERYLDELADDAEAVLRDG